MIPPLFAKARARPAVLENPVSAARPPAAVGKSPRLFDHTTTTEPLKRKLSQGDRVELFNRRLAEVTVAAPVGHIDHIHAQELQTALAPTLDELGARKGSLVLDFARVEYISSMGLRVLMMAAKRVRSHNGRIAVASLQPVVAEIFEIARFQHVLEVFPTVRAALQELSEPALAAYDSEPR